MINAVNLNHFKTKLTSINKNGSIYEKNVNRTIFIWTIVCRLQNNPFITHFKKLGQKKKGNIINKS